MVKTGKKLTDRSDSELVELARQQDQKAFSVLLTKYRNALMAHVMKFVSVTEDAEDICQRSFEKVFLSIEKYDSNFAFSTWLFNIAKNEAIDHLRRSKNIINSVPISDDNDAQYVLSGISPEEELIVDQAVSDMIKRIKQLPDRYCTVAELRFIKDYAYEDIAKELSIPIGTVKTRLNRARGMLMGAARNGDGKDS